MYEKECVDQNEIGLEHKTYSSFYSIDVIHTRCLCTFVLSARSDQYGPRLHDKLKTLCLRKHIKTSAQDDIASTTTIVYSPDPFDGSTGRAEGPTHLDLELENKRRAGGCLREWRPQSRLWTEERSSGIPFNAVCPVPCYGCDGPNVLWPGTNLYVVEISLEHAVSVGSPIGVGTEGGPVSIGMARLAPSRSLSRASSCIPISFDTPLRPLCWLFPDKFDIRSNISPPTVDVARMSVLKICGESSPHSRRPCNTFGTALT
ncbi:hypothetical protein EVAR_81267_1 [Eumeta japonica]|uniref:Uncharacterized protein n=1 Tax=Eumeta variegata TaxID=151549 RepID=A0A4C1WV43_EUMVA|nr:hypothetical protein EVAR_81267_1 [Eumeta japonica]